MRKKKLIIDGTKYRLYTGRYGDGTLAVWAEDKDGDYRDITVCLGRRVADGRSQFVDTNNTPDIDNILSEAGLAKHVGNYQSSGCWLYPMMVFNLEQLAQYCA